MLEISTSAEAPFPILKEALWTRLSVLELGESSLVMDRRNGCWVMISTADLPLLRLLSTEVSELPPVLQERCKSLISELKAAGLGSPEQTWADMNTLILKLTNACNYACTYCYDFEPEERAMRVELEIACKALEQSLELAPRALHVILHGGEPTLVFPLLREVVLFGETAARALGKKIVFSGQTNLSRLTDELVRFSHLHGIVWGISLDGPPELNDQFRVLHTGGGTYAFFERALQAFPAFVQSCGILTTVTSATDTHLLRIARHIRDTGCLSWDWSLFQPIGRGRCAADTLEFSVERVVRSWNQLFDSIEQGEFDGFDVRAVTKYLNNFLDGPGGNMCMRKECGAARDLMSVSVDGVVEACDCIDPKGPLSGLGDLRQPGNVLQEARNSERAELIRSRDVERGRCSSCIWLSVCGGTCLAHAGGSVHDVWEAQCAIAMNAFSRIATSLAQSDRLRRYRASLSVSAKRMS